MALSKSEHREAAVLQSWVTPKFAREIRELADRDGRSVSNLIRIALRDRLEASPTGENRRQGRASSSFTASASDAKESA